MPRAARVFLAGNTLSVAGTGLVIAFTIIYPHQVRQAQPSAETPRRL